tara:strand:+ start:40 stop:513 length:474 start_codon:yes stop_codon:yes gene_type:complete
MAIFNEYTPGLGSVGNYQVAGTPWLTASIIGPSGSSVVVGLNDSTYKVNFPYVTKEVTIVNLGSGEICCHLANDLGVFGDAGGGHAFTIPPSGTAPGSPLSKATFDMKTKEIYISNKHSQIGIFQVYASVTRIDRLRMFELTGSGINSMPGDATITP